MKRFLALNGAALLLLLVLVGCGEPPRASQPGGTPGTAGSAATSTPPQAADAWAPLRQKPLHLPALAPGAACPAAREKRVTPDLGLALGDGPLYAVAPWKHGTYSGGEVAANSAGWYPLKVLWASAPSFRGPALIRGHQLDGPNELRFDAATGLPAELELRFLADGSSATPGGWNNLASYTTVRAPGCYAYQVDTAGSSSVIVFEIADL
jgi:hypothetical protein